jgi:plastocyanin
MQGFGDPQQRSGSWRRAFGVGLILAAGACGKGDTGPSPLPPTNPFQITIGANGVATPSELVVPPGSRVLFINNHSRDHQMSSDPHPDHDDCTEINQTGVLQPRQVRETGNLVTVRTCGFHDHQDSTNNGLRGRIVIR